MTAEGGTFTMKFRCSWVSFPLRGVLGDDGTVVAAAAVSKGLRLVAGSWDRVDSDVVLGRTGPADRLEEGP